MSLREKYLKLINKKRTFVLFLIFALIILSFISINIGSSYMGFKESLSILLGGGDERARHIVYNIRIPRLLAGIFVGAGMALSGLLMQTALNNSLASPQTLGVSNASVFGANVGLILAARLFPHVKLFPVGLFSFIAAMICMGLVLYISNLKKFSRTSIILSGVAFGSLFSAGTTIIQYFADDTEIASAVFWTFGDLGRIVDKEILVLAITFTLSFLYFYTNRWKLNAMDHGDVVAQSLGLDIRLMRNISISIACLNTALSVAFVGMIGFVGLISPQITKRIVGEDKRFMLPGSVLMGSVVTIFADVIARTIMKPIVLPVGTITSFFGAPLFIYILLREKNDA